MSYWEPSQFWQNAGTVVVFREGFQSLDAATLKAFSAFCATACVGNDEEAGRRSEISLQSWEAHLAQYKNNNGGMND